MANWLIFSKISEWPDLMLTGFQYDKVSDEDITSALANISVIASIDTNLDWEDDEYLSGTRDVSEDKKHAHRIAALVRELRDGGDIRNAVEIDTFCIDRCCSGVTNGHHRIRAMQFLGMECGPFSLSGSLDMLEELVRLAGAECPVEFKMYFGESLLAAAKDDVPAAAWPRRLSTFHLLGALPLAAPSFARPTQPAIPRFFPLAVREAPPAKMSLRRAVLCRGTGVPLDPRPCGQP